MKVHVVEYYDNEDRYIESIHETEESARKSINDMPIRDIYKSDYSIAEHEVLK